MLNVLIVDDEAPAHDVLAHHCHGAADVRIIGHCHNAAEALTALQALSVDLMFLDVRMPGFGGLDLLRGLANPPLVIIVSAHREHALDGYDLDVVDYLLKPVSVERFDSSLDKARRRLSPPAGNKSEESDYLILKVDRSARRFRLDDISHFEAHGNFVKVWTGHAAVTLATTTLRQLLATLQPNRFVQVHKSFIVNCDHAIEQRRNSLILASGIEVPIGKSFRASGKILR